MAGTGAAKEAIIEEEVQVGIVKEDGKASATKKAVEGELREKLEESSLEDNVVKEEDVEMDKEPRTGVLFPIMLANGKQLNSMGCRRKKILALGINIYAFGMYADNAKLRELLQVKIGKPAPQKPTKELYEAVINCDVTVVVRLIIVFSGLTMSVVRKNFDEGLGASIKKLSGGQKNEDLVNMVMSAAKDSMKLSPGSVIEVTRLPGFVLQTKVKEEVISRVESELLCRAYLNMYLGDEPFDKEAKERFGASLLSLF